MAAGRWTIIEYGEPSRALSEMSATSGLPAAEIRRLIESKGTHIALNLGMASPPLFIERESIRAIKIAGIVRIAPGIEIEIAPKFLGDDKTDTRWREDFFYLATLSRHGRVLPSERLLSGRTVSRDLPSLVARAMIEMERTNHRRPLRTYRRTNEWDFALDGDVDPETALLPSPDGFEQNQIRYDRHNVYNATIRMALESLLRDVRDPSLRVQMERIAAELGDQPRVRDARNRMLPTRARRWQDLYDLSVDVLDGLGISFETRGLPKSPGYVVSTWQVWEDVLAIATRLGFPDLEVRAQVPLGLGKRVEVGPGKGRIVSLLVTPDLSIGGFTEDFGALLLDAKYKTRASQSQQRIDEADIYESLAFAGAAKSKTVALLYPAVPGNATRKLGFVALFEKILVDDVTIYGLGIDVRGISAVGGLREFSREVRIGITSTLNLNMSGSVEC